MLLSEMLSPGDILVVCLNNGYIEVAWFIGGPGRAGLMFGLNLRRPILIILSFYDQRVPNRVICALVGGFHSVP